MRRKITRNGKGSSGNDNPPPPPPSNNEEVLNQIRDAIVSLDARLKKVENNGTDKERSRIGGSHSNDMGRSMHQEDDIENPCANQSMSMVWKHLHHFHPPTFPGGTSPTKAEEWIDRMEMLFESVECTSNKRSR